MKADFAWEVRMPSLRFDRVRALKAESRFIGRVELKKAVAEGPWGMVAIVGCDNETDAALLRQVADGDV